LARVLAHRAAKGLGACSPNTASYCNARARLPTGVLRTLARRSARELQAGAPAGWRWNGRNVYVADGSHVSMPDTPQNQAAYPQPPTQQSGLGFPLARVAVLLSLATGACHDLAVAAYAGKGTGETTLLREMYGALAPGDVVLADALFDNYFLACELRDRGIDLVTRAQSERFGTRVVRSGADGDVIAWQRPNKPRGMTGEQYRTYPKTLLMRQVSVDASEPQRRAPGRAVGVGRSAAGPPHRLPDGGRAAGRRLPVRGAVLMRETGRPMLAAATSAQRRANRSGRRNLNNNRANGMLVPICGLPPSGGCVSLESDCC
jgi:hypothetical protein